MYGMSRAPNVDKVCLRLGDGKMKRVLFGITAALILALCTVPQAQAASFMRINVDGTILTCDNSGACGAGFTTALNSNSITFSGTVAGVSFPAIVLSGNSPGNPAIANFSDTKVNVLNTDNLAHTIIIDTAQNGYTQPLGNGFLSASQTANWTQSANGDSQAFQSWFRQTNDFIIPGGNTTANTPPCVSPGGLAQSCASEALNVATNGVLAPFALTQRETITINATPLGGLPSLATYDGRTTLTANVVPVIPEPSSVLLLGTGMLMLAG